MLFSLIEKISLLYEKEVAFDELNCGDLIILPETKQKAVIVELTDEWGDVITEKSTEASFGNAPQHVIRKIPIALEDWLIWALRDDIPIRGFLMRSRCWKCQEFGWAFFLVTEQMLVTDGESVFKYPGVRRQLREFFAMRLDVRADFGRVTKRFSKTVGRKYLSQGCPKCDALWGNFPLSEEANDYLLDWEEFPNDLDHSQLKHAFTLDLYRLFDE
jgi:hypothetical protein